MQLDGIEWNDLSLTANNFSLLIQLFREARRTVPSILYIPHIHLWWETVGITLKATFLTLIRSIPSFSPILLLATSDMEYGDLDSEVIPVFWIRIKVMEKIASVDIRLFPSCLATFLSLPSYFRLGQILIILNNYAIKPHLKYNSMRPNIPLQPIRFFFFLIWHE